MKNIWTWAIQDGDIQLSTRADQAIAEALRKEKGKWNSSPLSIEGLSRSRIQKLFAEEKIFLNGKIAKMKSKLNLGDQIEVHFPPAEAIDLEPENIPLEILFQDEHLAIVNKPPRLNVHPSETERSSTLVNALLFHIQDLSGIGGKLRPGIVHRIDKNTSGSLLITKTDIAHQKMAKLFEKHDIDRRYHALCYGLPEIKGEIRVESLIGRNPHDRRKMTSEVKEGRNAVTYFKVIETYAESGKNPFATLLEARLETGRTHQVRVHLSQLGHSILGDPLYGVPSARQNKWLSLPREIQDAVKKLPGQALHARVLSFIHPITYQKIETTANYPSEFSLLLESLRRYR